MNTAQQNIKEVAEKLKASSSIDKTTKVYFLSFLRKLYVLWNGYREDRYSFPSHQIKHLEETYGCSMAYIKNRI